MQYLTLKKEYEAKKANASFTLKMKKIEYVLQQHHVFYERVHKLFKSFDLSNGPYFASHKNHSGHTIHVKIDLLEMTWGYAIHQTPSRYTKGIAKNMEQILCLAFISNDLVITFHSMEEDIQRKRKAYPTLICLKGSIE
jgi:hypothetical protein